MSPGGSKRRGRSFHGLTGRLPAVKVKVRGVAHDVADLNLADQGQELIDWAAREMPVLAQVRDRFASDRPLDGIRMSGCLHITTETANLALALQAGGAELTLCASNPLSTQDPVAAALVKLHDISVFARKGEDNDTYYQHLRAAAVDARPQMTMDDGCDLVSLLHKGEGDIDAVLGGTEETTTGVSRLKAMQREGVLRFPIVAVNEALTKHMFDNRYRTGQATLDGILRAHHLPLS